MAEKTPSERKLETFQIRGKEYQRDAKTGAVVLSFPKSAMRTEDEVARDDEKAKSDADPNT